jgi:hypothetical protein
MGCRDPPFAAPVDHVMVGRDGSVGLRVTSGEEQRSVYRVIDPATERVGELSFPGRIRTLAGDVSEVGGGDGRGGDTL